MRHLSGFLGDNTALTNCELDLRPDPCREERGESLQDPSEPFRKQCHVSA
jgi:hypothetical protein